MVRLAEREGGRAERPRPQDADQAPGEPLWLGDKLRAYLELVRPPNLFTAAADVLAGYFTVSVVRGQFDGQALTYLLIATVCLYGGGVALNDYFDEPLDRRERPERPLPSGRVSRAGARRLVIGLFVLACLSAASVGVVSLVLALAIVFTASVYDAIGKRTTFGPLNMGLCRFLNLLLGVSAVPGLVLDRTYLAFVLFVHVAGVTLLSRGEVWGGTRLAVLGYLTGLTFISLSLALLGAVGDLPRLAFLPFLAAYVLVAGVPAVRALSDPAARNVGRAVKWGVLGLVLLDAAFAAAYADWSAGLAVAALLIPSILFARLFAVT